MLISLQNIFFSFSRHINKKYIYCPIILSHCLHGIPFLLVTFLFTSYPMMRSWSKVEETYIVYYNFEL